MDSESGRGMDVSVCVPVYRRHGPPNLATLGEDLPAALDGLKGELIVVLNGISARRAQVPPSAVVIDMERNRGVPVAWNQAMLHARGRIMAFVNDDVRLGPRSLKMLAQALDEHRDAGVVGPVGSRWDIGLGRHLEYVTDADLLPGTTQACDVCSGFLIATPRSVLLQVGGFDEAFAPCGFEEVDYCTAIRLKLGLRCLAVAGIPHSHDFGISAHRAWRRVRFDGRSESIKSISSRNHAYFVTKWRPAAEAQLTGNT